jgi:ribonuclease VapC
MMVDSSALIAILTAEPEADGLADVISRTEATFTTPVVVLECALVLASRISKTVRQAADDIEELLARYGIALKPVGEEALGHALLAGELYGKGRGHPAQLNLVDCLSYGAARAAGVGLIYKGNDFGMTDLPQLPPANLTS